jgi:hypothetical protein
MGLNFFHKASPHKNNFPLVSSSKLDLSRSSAEEVARSAGGVSEGMSRLWRDRGVFAAIISLLVLVVGVYIYQHRADFLGNYDGEYWFDRYQHSQYLQGDRSDYILSTPNLTPSKVIA